MFHHEHEGIEIQIKFADPFIGVSLGLSNLKRKDFELSGFHTLFKAAGSKEMLNVYFSLFHRS